MSSIKVNGKDQDLNGVETLSGLMKSNNVLQPEMVSIQVNGKFVDRNDYETTPINAGDEVDFLYFMGGGSL